MIQKTPEEKAAIKAAKKSWKQNGYDRPSVRIQQKQSDIKPKPQRILDGLMYGENILADDHRVNYDYLYVAQQSDGSYKVRRSDIKGTIRDLKDDIFKLTGFRPPNIFNCKIAIRNLF